MQTLRALMYQNQTTSKSNCKSLVFYLVPKVSCSVPAAKDTVHCNSILFHDCRAGHFGRRRQWDRRRRSRCSALPGHSLLSFVGRCCLSVSAAERRENTDGDVPATEIRTLKHNWPDGTVRQCLATW